MSFVSAGANQSFSTVATTEPSHWGEGTDHFQPPLLTLPPTLALKPGPGKNVRLAYGAKAFLTNELFQPGPGQYNLYKPEGLPI